MDQSESRWKYEEARETSLPAGSEILPSVQLEGLERSRSKFDEVEYKRWSDKLRSSTSLGKQG